jgi:hypothetical protein
MKLLAGFEMGKISLMLDLLGPLIKSYGRSPCRQASDIRTMIACVLELALTPSQHARYDPRGRLTARFSNGLS